MLLVIDVGNTNITMGVYDGKNLKTTFRMMSKQPRTSDEYGITLRELLRTNEVEKEEIEGVIMASVVPNVMHSLVNGITKYIGRSPMIVGPGVKTGIRVTSENPREIGADRIVDVVAAYEKYGEMCIRDRHNTVPWFFHEPLRLRRRSVLQSSQSPQHLYDPHQSLYGISR